MHRPAICPPTDSQVLTLLYDLTIGPASILREAYHFIGCDFALNTRGACSGSTILSTDQTKNRLALVTRIASRPISQLRSRSSPLVEMYSLTSSEGSESGLSRRALRR